MRTKEQFLMLWMLGGMMLAGLAACSGDYHYGDRGGGGTADNDSRLAC